MGRVRPRNVGRVELGAVHRGRPRMAGQAPGALGQTRGQAGGLKGGGVEQGRGLWGSPWGAQEGFQRHTIGAPQGEPCAGGTGRQRCTSGAPQRGAGPCSAGAGGERHTRGAPQGETCAGGTGRERLTSGPPQQRGASAGAEGSTQAPPQPGARALHFRGPQYHPAPCRLRPARPSTARPYSCWGAPGVHRDLLSTPSTGGLRRASSGIPPVDLSGPCSSGGSGAGVAGTGKALAGPPRPLPGPSAVYHWVYQV